MRTIIRIAGLYIPVKQLLGGINMKFQKVNIATARIKGLEKPPYYFDHYCYYAWNIMFEGTSTLFFNNLTFIKVGNTEEGENSVISLKRISKKHIFMMAIKLLLFSEMTVVFWQSAAQEKTRGLIQLTNLSRKLSQNSILLLHL